jgi:hypothetical protein
VRIARRGPDRKCIELKLLMKNEEDYVSPLGRKRPDPKIVKNL